MQRIAVLGQGKITRRTAVAMVEDTLEAATGDHRLILPVPREASNLVKYVSEWAVDTGVPIEAVVGKEDPEDPTVDEIVEASVRTHVATASWVDTLVGLLEPGDRVLMAYGDGDRDSDRVLALAARIGVHCYDLTDGLTRLVWEEDDELQPEPEPVAEAGDSLAEEPDDEPVLDTKPKSNSADETWSATSAEISSIIHDVCTATAHKAMQVINDMEQELYRRFGELR